MLENESMNTAQNVEEMEDNESELTPYRAQSIFENAVINMANESLPEEDQIHSDEKFSLRWFIDKNFPDGHFGLMRSITSKKNEPKPEALVTEIDEETGETFIVEKMTGPVEPMEDVTIYNLNTAAVKETFMALKPEVQEIFLNGWTESLAENKTQLKKLKATLNGDLRRNEKEKINQKIGDFIQGQENIERMLEALQ